VRRLMGTDQLAKVATWADDIRPQRRETAPWHYVNIPSSAKNYDSQRDCPEGECVVEKLKQFSAKLRDGRQPLSARQDALRWVIHLAGDIISHSTRLLMRAAAMMFQSKKLGLLIVARYSCELHALWDTDMLRHTASASGDTYFNLKS
jgi:nuclease S1